MPFVLETIQSPSKETLTKIFKQFEFSNHKQSKCYEQNKSENIEENLLENIIQRAVRLTLVCELKYFANLNLQIISLNTQKVKRVEGSL